MRRHISTSFVLVTGVFFFETVFILGCSPKEHDAVVATVGTKPVRLTEYETQYLKTLGSRAAGAATTMDEREKFLDLIVKYRLKLAEAYQEQIDKKPEVISEIEAYKGSLAASYLTEREVVSPGVKKLYERRNEEIRASHILLSLAPNASPTDSALAYTKAYNIIAQLKKGEDFGRLAVQNSIDPSVNQNQGDIYYFTAGQLVAPFEDAVFGMSVGEISSVPVRTQFGLHIIKVTHRKPAPGEIRASHIMIRFGSQQPSPDDTLRAYNRIRTIRDSLIAGADFAELAMRNSEDPGSSGRGGDLGYFTRRRWVQPFDEVAMTLKPSQVSDIVRTVYGYHLIKCYDIRPRKSYDEAKAELQPIYQQLRFQDEYTKFVDGVKNQVRYTKYDSVVAHLLASLDTNKTTRDSAWWSTIPPALGKLPLFGLAGNAISVDSSIVLINTRPDLKGSALRPSAFATVIDKLGEQLAFSAKADLLAKNVPDFGSLLQEYREGILLYQVEQENVWNRVATNDSVLKAFFAANRNKFSWPDRVNFTEVKTSNDSLARVVYGMVTGGKSLEQIATADSIRLAAPASYRVFYRQRDTALDKAARNAFTAFAAEMKPDRTLRLVLTARPDTTVKKSMRLKLASARLEAARAYLTKTLRVDTARVTTTLDPLPVTVGDTTAPPAQSREVLEVQLSGRAPLVLGKPETILLAPATDDRSRRADSLAVGSVSSPFAFNGLYAIVRLNKREKARAKTFEEVGAELSSAYQDYESKRLENEWLARLNRSFPVVKNIPVLKNAFAPEPK